MTTRHFARGKEVNLGRIYTIRPENRERLLDSRDLLVATVRELWRGRLDSYAESSRGGQLNREGLHDPRDISSLDRLTGLFFI